MKISDKTLVFYYYKDGLTTQESAAVDQALAEDRDVAERYATLVKDMENLREAFLSESVTIDTRQWERVLDDAVDSESLSRYSASRLVQYPGIAIAATLLVFVAGFLIGTRLDSESNENSAAPVVVHSIPGQGPEPDLVPVSFVRGMATHFESTQIQLASMDLENNAERDALILEMVSRNRFFLNAAIQNDAEDVARLLRAFEPLLLSMRSTSQEDQGRSVEQPRDQLEFELGVTLTKFDRQTSNRTNRF